MAITIKDIARMANTSIATVSRVLSDKPGVGKDKRAEVWEIVRETGYQPHQHARSLVTKKSNTLGFVVSDLFNPVYVQVFRHIESQFRARGYQVFLTDSELDLDKEKLNLDLMRQNRVEALVVIPVHDFKIDQDIDHILAMKKEGFPVILMGKADSPNLDFVTSEEEESAYRLTRHLIELGHKKIAFVGHFELNRCTTERYQGAEKAMKEIGRSLFEYPIIKNDENIYENVNALLMSKNRPTALMVANDTSAVLCIQHLKRLSLSIPEDISVTGFGDLLPAQIVTPTLTSCAENVFEINETLTRLIQQRLESPNGTIEQCMVPQKLLIRESTGLVPSQIKAAKPIAD